MKFKEIKPGMVIHCPKEEDARALLEHLNKQGYFWRENEEEIAKNDSKYAYYFISDDATLGWYDRPSKYAITEFSDLIEPDKPQMSAAEVLEWLMKHRGKMEFKECFGQLYAMDILFNLFTAEEILNKITAYEAAKKAPKPVAVEWADVCRIIQIQDNGFKKCVYEEEIPKDTADCLGIAEEILKRYISDHDGEHIAVIEDVCRVKEGK